MAEYIERKAVLNALGEIPISRACWQGVKDCYETIKALPAVDAEQVVRGQWISVKDRLPEKDGRYLCVWQGKAVDTIMFLNGHFRVYGEIHDRLVTHWIPLPETPKEVPYETNPF